MHKVLVGDRLFYLTHAPPSNGLYGYSTHNHSHVFAHCMHDLGNVVYGRRLCVDTWGVVAVAA